MLCSKRFFRVLYRVSEGYVGGFFGRMWMVKRVYVAASSLETISRALAASSSIEPSLEMVS